MRQAHFVLCLLYEKCCWLWFSGCICCHIIVCVISSCSQGRHWLGNIGGDKLTQGGRYPGNGSHPVESRGKDPIRGLVDEPPPPKADTYFGSRCKRMHAAVLSIHDHGLYDSTSCCISHGPCQWERAIFDPPPQLGDPSTDFHET